MKKRSVGIMAAVLSLSMLASCGGTAKQKAETDAKAAVKGAMDSVIAYDVEKLKTFVKDEKSIEYIDNTFGVTQSMFKNMGQANELFSGELFDKMKGVLADKCLSKLSYEIKNIEVNDDTNSAVVTVSINMPDFSKVDMSQEVIEKYATDAFGFSFNDASMILSKYAERTGKSIAEIMASMSGADTSKAVKDLFAAFEPELLTFVSNLLTDAMANCPATSIESKFTVDKQEDGKWLITAIQ